MKKNITLNSSKSKREVNVTNNISINFNENHRYILNNDYNKVLSQTSVFETERNSCAKYRLTITPNIIASNVLHQTVTTIFDENDSEVTGETKSALIQTLPPNYTYRFGLDVFDNHYLRLNTFKTGNTIMDYSVYDIGDMFSIKKSIFENRIEDNGWFGFRNKTKINDKKMLSWRYPNEKIDLFPNREYFGLAPIVNGDNVNYNWDYIVTYPSSSNKDHVLINSLSGVNGIPIFKAETGYTTELDEFLLVQTPYNHGLKSGDVIRLKETPYATGRTYQIYSIGDANGENTLTCFMLDIGKYKDLKNINNIRDRRVVKYTNGVESEYYIRIFTKIPNITSPDTYKLGFAKNIYSDDIYQIQYVDDIIVSGLTDNLNRPLTQINITFIKRNSDSDPTGHNSVFSELVSGINELPGVSGFTNVRTLNPNNILETSIESNITISGTSYGENMFMGDIVEHNKYLAKEFVLEDIYYRFNLLNREKENDFYYHEFVGGDLNVNSLLYLKKRVIPPKNEGYFYKPHYKVTIKNFSVNKRQGEITKINPCDEEVFVSGVTADDVIINLTPLNTDNLKYLLLKTSDKFEDYDRLRISKTNGNGDITNVKTVYVRVSHEIPQHVLIPYDDIFFDDIFTTNYLFGKYYSDEIPSEAITINEGLVVWRDIMQEGVFDSNSDSLKEFTYTNGRLYVNTELNIQIRRQDPFGYYGIKDMNYLSDLFGAENAEYINNNRYKKPNNIC